MDKREKNRIKNNKRKARMAKKYFQEAAKRNQENQLRFLIETWAAESGLKYDTLKDLVGLKFN